MSSRGRSGTRRPWAALARLGGLAALAALGAMMTGCMPEEDPGDGTGGKGDPGDTTLEKRDMGVRAVDWTPDGDALGKVTAVVERGATTAAFGDTGAVLFTNGAHEVTDPMLTTVEAAAVIPAADHNGLWIAGADAAGTVWRLFAGEQFEAVSTLYGLEGDAVSGLAPIGATGTVFTVAGGLAVSDGTNVTRYDTGALTGVTAGGGRIAGVSPEGVVVFKAQAEEMTAFDLPGAAAVAFDDEGRLLALTPEAIYREDAEGALVEIYASEGAGLLGLAAAPGRVWFSDGTIAGLVDPDGVALSPEGALPDGAVISGSPTGDVWVIAGGALSRLALDIGTDGARQAWEADIEPIFEKACTPCHLPGGTAPVHLSTYDAWETHRTSLKQRVLEKKDMPPQGFELSDDDRKAIGDWLSAE